MNFFDGLCTESTLISFVTEIGVIGCEHKDVYYGRHIESSSGGFSVLFIGSADAQNLSSFSSSEWPLRFPQSTSDIKLPFFQQGT